MECEDEYKQVSQSIGQFMADSDVMSDARWGMSTVYVQYIA